MAKKQGKPARAKRQDLKGVVEQLFDVQSLLRLVRLAQPSNGSRREEDEAELCDARGVALAWADEKIGAAIATVQRDLVA